MKKLFVKTVENHATIYKAVLYVLAIVLVVFLLPKNSQFPDYQKGKAWQYKDYYAPFDFSILKTAEEIEEEKENLIKNSKHYFFYKPEVPAKAKEIFNENISKIVSVDSILIQQDRMKSIGNEILDTVYKFGYINPSNEEKLGSSTITISIRNENELQEVRKKSLVTSSKLTQLMSKEAVGEMYESEYNILLNLLSNAIEPNVFFDKNFTDKALEESLEKISYTKGFIAEKERVILKGDIVEGRSWAMLNSIKKEFESKVWSKTNYYWIIFGYTLLVALSLLMLLLFLRKYRTDIFEDNNKITFIFFNIIVMVLLITFVIKYNVDYIYVVPLVILPLVLKAFFDARLGLFTHVLTVLILGFVVPNSFEFIFIQIIAGMVTILTISELYKRSNLFISVLQITFIYFLTYFAFYIIQEGNIDNIHWEKFGYFILNGATALFVLPLIYVYEKLFSLVSDESLKELSNTNSKLLRLLAEKAPGTFQHSLQVANLAEAAAIEINANAMLVRTGALYHDIGKMQNPQYFIENQSMAVNPHNELLPKDSATIIINHVLDGIEIAKKNKLPDRIIDFIRTHHGTSLVYYFYKQEEANNPDGVEMSDFQYPGPIPFSKETSILMICDAIEAASRSVKEPTAEIMNSLVEKIVDKQMEEKQFMNADITFKELQSVKKVLKKKLMNIYHLRVEYPE